MGSTLILIDRPNCTAVRRYTNCSEVWYMKRLKRVRSINKYIVSYRSKAFSGLTASRCTAIYVHVTNEWSFFNEKVFVPCCVCNKRRVTHLDANGKLSLKSDIREVSLKDRTVYQLRKFSENLGRAVGSSYRWFSVCCSFFSPEC